MSSPTLSTLSREELEARCVRVEALVNRAVAVCAGYEALLIEARLQNIAMADVLQQQVAEHTELRRQLANVTPFAALDALRSAPGWQATTPTLEEINAHAEAFQVGTDDESGDDDPDAELCGGLWAFRDEGGVGVVELYQGRRRTPWVNVPGPAASLRLDCGELCAWAQDERVTAWLRLTADGRPVVR